MCRGLSPAVFRPGNPEARGPPGLDTTVRRGAHPPVQEFGGSLVPPDYKRTGRNLHTFFPKRSFRAYSSGCGFTTEIIEILTFLPQIRFLLTGRKLWLIKLTHRRREVPNQVRKPAVFRPTQRQASRFCFLPSAGLCFSLSKRKVPTS